jgi:UDP-glucuronate 4-epimerase
MAFVYGRNYGLRTTGLRYFTVYGPWGRPDMSPWLFMDAILNGGVINVFNHGNMIKDFTYIDDVVKGTVLVLDGNSSNLTNIFNIGSHAPVKLMDFIILLELKLGIKANKNYISSPKGYVTSTYADISFLKNSFDFIPEANIDDGINKCLEWYMKYKRDFLFRKLS